ncbi:MAG: hypothetical protein UU67_C0044G0008 [Candidatus Daviesbacteria bacterium GW2011_GWB1_41_5]|uniref:Glycosyltransferase RgtA/B/C/D-like domain-containing protein n=1 Tax=Candidatus Daviesbacteria bacterium GW2011_GWB1_41_5 TaxID=1618429 RepID=A0A0G0YSN9_9BACT|nr:MAG: hypothetical protein UU67_C0044G0008 [Candidatus Daviesbacteria bacterium GW2011_GWB1_41_5]
MIFQNKRTGDYFYLLILSIVTIYIWYPLTNLVLQWESYTYLIKHFYLPLYTDTWRSFANFDVQSMFTGSILSKLVGLNIPLYFWVEIVSILSINICLYFLTKTITKNPTAAFVTAILFSVYFFGTEFFAPNYYATFLQRIILNVPLLLISFLLLHRFLEEKKYKLYISSVFLYFISIFLAHFGVLFSFAIFLYPIFWHIVVSFRIRSLFRGLIISLPYLVIAMFFWQIQKMFGETMEPKISFLFFLTHPERYHYIEGTIRQLVYMSQYPSVIQAIRSGSSPFSHVDPISTYKFVVPIILAYIVGTVIIWVKRKSYRVLLLTVISGLLISYIVNIYLARFDVRNAAGLNRYYYYPSFLLSFFWSMLLTTVFPKNKVVIYIILMGFFLVNASLFSQYFNDLQRYAAPTKNLYKYIVSNFDEFPLGSLVIMGPTPIFGPYETAFYTEQLGERENIVFCTVNPSYPRCKEAEPTAKHIIRLLYDMECSCIRKEILK